MVKSKRNFCKMKKVRVEICNIHITFKGPKKFIFWTIRKTQMPSYFFPIPNIEKTHMETLPLRVIYIFNHVVLDFVLKMF